MTIRAQSSKNSKEKFLLQILSVNRIQRCARRMIERILTQYGNLGVEFDSDDLEYLLTKMGQLPPDTPNTA